MHSVDSIALKVRHWAKSAGGHSVFQRAIDFRRDWGGSDLVFLPLLSAWSSLLQAGIMLGPKLHLSKAWHALPAAWTSLVLSPSVACVGNRRAALTGGLSFSSLKNPHCSICLPIEVVCGLCTKCTVTFCLPYLRMLCPLIMP